MTERTIILPPASNGNGHDAAYRLTVMVPKRRYLSYLRERFWVILVCLALMVGATVVYETIRPEAFTSFAQLYVSGDVLLNNVGSLFSEDSQNYFGTQIELLKSARLQGAAYETAGIKLEPEQKNPYKVDIVQPMKTSILQLRVNGPDPGKTQRFLQALVDGYLAYKKETRRSSSEDVLASLTEQVAKQENELRTNQESLIEFQKANNLAVLEEEGKSAGLYLNQLELELAKLKLEQKLLEEGLSASPVPQGTNELLSSAVAVGVTNTLSLTNLNFMPSDVALKTAKVELGVRRAERDTLVKEHGEVAGRRLGAEIERLESTVALLEQENLEQKKRQLEETTKRIAAMQEAIPSWEAKVLKLNDRLSDGQRLKNNIQREQGFYDHLLTTLQSVDLSKNVQQERLSVLQAATPPRPAQNYFASKIALAAFAGLALALGLVFVWYLLDDRFVSVRDIKDQFGEMVLGLVPQIRVPRSNPKQVLLQSGDSRKAYAESYRHLRSAILLSSLGESRPQTLLFTGACPAEGKTTIAVNLARVLARSGMRVALADMDAHGRGVHRLLGGPAEPGVLDFLRGEAPIQSIMHQTEIPGLNLVPAGSHTEHAEGLFLRPTLDDLMAELRKDHDLVILDGAPILAADDAALLVPHADVVIMVVRPFYTRSRLVRQALDMLYQRQAKQVAIVLNRARAEDLAGHYAQNGINRMARNGAEAKS